MFWYTLSVVLAAMNGLMALMSIAMGTGWLFNAAITLLMIYTAWLHQPKICTCGDTEADPCGGCGGCGK